MIYQANPIISLLTVPIGIQLGFKALASNEFPEIINSDDWSALYPQLSFANAVCYLPNQFDRGHSTAILSRLTVKKEFSILLYLDAVFMDVKISSKEKAQRLRSAANKVKEKLSIPKIYSESLLMESFGKIGMGLIVWDAEGPEIVLPSSIVNGDYLDIETLFVIKENELVPGTVGKVVGEDYKRHVLSDLKTLTTLLEEQVEDCSCQKMQELINESLSKGIFIE